MINEATDKLSKIARDFAAIYQHEAMFINGVNAQIEEHTKCKVLKTILW